jgi:integrase/recombinase XerD
MHPQPDIFDIPSIWKADPMKAFGGFIASTEFVEMGKHGRARKAEGREVHPISKESAQVYTHMFGNFVRWMDLRRLRLHEVDQRQLRSFLDHRHAAKDTDGKKLNSAIRLRYLRLLERVFIHLGATPNPVTKLAYEVNKSPTDKGIDKPKVYLDDKAQFALLAGMPPIAAYDQANPASPSWKKRRDRAMLAMMLGAGLKVSEVIALRVDYVGRKDSAGEKWIKVRNPSSHGPNNSHKTVLRHFAEPYVTSWIEERKLHKIPGKLLFPASLKAGEELNKATVYRHVKATLLEAGLDVERMGGRTLRNSFAVRELRHNTPVETVGEFLGHFERRSTEKYVINEHQKTML